jgi:hypothetical protein
MADHEDLKSSPGEAGCGFDSHRRYLTGNARKRQEPCFPRVSSASTQEHSAGSSCLEAHSTGSKRPSTATLNATRPLSHDADVGLIAVNDAWPRLPEALKAGIVAMVKAADRRVDR